MSTEKDITIENKRVERDKESKVEHVWEEMKLEMVESAREACGSVRGKNPNCVW